MKEMQTCAREKDTHRYQIESNQSENVHARSRDRRQGASACERTRKEHEVDARKIAKMISRAQGNSIAIKKKHAPKREKMKRTVENDQINRVKKNLSWEKNNTGVSEHDVKFEFV